MSESKTAEECLQFKCKYNIDFIASVQQGPGFMVGMTRSTNFVGGPCLAGPPVVIFTNNEQDLMADGTLSLRSKNYNPVITYIV